MNKFQAERAAKSVFTTPGMQVALVRNGHYGRSIEGPFVIARVHKTGNFTLANAPREQWVPRSDGNSSYRAGPHYGCGNLEPWTPEIEREAALYKKQIEWNGEKYKLIAKLQGLHREDLSQELIDALEAALADPCRVMQRLS